MTAVIEQFAIPETAFQDAAADIDPVPAAILAPDAIFRIEIRRGGKNLAAHLLPVVGMDQGDPVIEPGFDHARAQPAAEDEGAVVGQPTAGVVAFPGADTDLFQQVVDSRIRVRREGSHVDLRPGGRLCSLLGLLADSTAGASAARVPPGPAAPPQPAMRSPVFLSISVL